MALPRKKRRFPRKIRVFWILYWVGLFVATHVPVPTDLLLPVPQGDKLLHLLTYFALAMLGGRALPSQNRPNHTTRLLVWAGIYVAYAGADEWLQQFVGRTSSGYDWVVDVIGVLAATTILMSYRKSTIA